MGKQKLKCEYCGNDIRADEKCCSHCGAPNMYMKRFTCEYCGGDVGANEKNCSHCGAPNNHVKRTFDGIPKTLEELDLWYTGKRRIRDGAVRFCIGYNIPNPNIFGIFKDGDNFVVYHNSGSIYDNSIIVDESAVAETREIKYEGPDENKAVTMVYLKIQEETAARGKRARAHKAKVAVFWLILALIVVAAGLTFSRCSNTPKTSGTNTPYNYYKVR